MILRLLHPLRHSLPAFRMRVACHLRHSVRQEQEFDDAEHANQNSRRGDLGGMGRTHASTRKRLAYPIILIPRACPFPSPVPRIRTPLVPIPISIPPPNPPYPFLFPPLYWLGSPFPLGTNPLPMGGTGHCFPLTLLKNPPRYLVPRCLLAAPPEVPALSLVWVASVVTGQESVTVQRLGQ